MSCAKKTKTAEPIEMPFGLKEACTLVPPGEYEWTVHLRRWCGLFVKLLR